MAAREGAAVVVNDLGADGSGGEVGTAEDVADLIKAEGDRAIVNGANVADPLVRVRTLKTLCYLWPSRRRDQDGVVTA